MLRPLPRPTLFPYTTLFRSEPHRHRRAVPSRRAHEWWARRVRRRAAEQAVAARPRVVALSHWATLSPGRSEEHTSELQSHHDLVCRLLLEKKKNKNND